MGEMAWTYTIETSNDGRRMRAVATHRSGKVIRSTWWGVDDGSAEAELGDRVRKWERAQALREGAEVALREGPLGEEPVVRPREYYLDDDDPAPDDAPPKRSVQDGYVARVASIQRTHWEGCWRDPAHHGCAVAEVERLRPIVEAVRVYPPVVREVVEGAMKRAGAPPCGLGRPDADTPRIAGEAVFYLTELIRRKEADRATEGGDDE